ncbi:hypothetical protein [Frigoribacterium sp. SL97]|uniref:hypothetical protein n=1 Tax=Frigoribacterium sp. SL97 TaxID=2994664 RepID=UPI00226F3A3B|nr:hypothetical protein [Frigoribacterium sp. SL97]WAC50503.1 hypothetical protein OVA02_11535 [Frigoribacterium sp. SL97]
MSDAFAELGQKIDLPPINSEFILSIDTFLGTVLSSGRGVDFATSLLQEATELLKAPPARVSSMTESQAAFLVSSGAMTEEQLEESEASVARGELSALERRTRLEAVAGSLSSAEVAARLDRDASSIRHRVVAGTLYSFLVGTKRRFPAWQFTDDAKQPVLPGLPALVAAIPEEMHASSVQGFMTTRQEDLRIEDTQVTPAEWLQLGKPVQEVVDILDSFLQS